MSPQRFGGPWTEQKLAALEHYLKAYLRIFTANPKAARPMRPEWVDNVRRQAEAIGAAFFFKQWGAWGADGRRRAKKANGRVLNGRTWDETPGRWAGG